MKYRKWRYSEICRIEEMRKQGKRAKEIAAELGATPRQICSLVSCYQMPRIYRVWTPEEDATMWRMTADGKNSLEIGAALGRSPDCINSRKYNLRKKK